MKKIIILAVAIAFSTSCVDSLDDYNVDQKRASAVPAPTLFSNAVKNLIDNQNTPNVNVNNTRLYVQQWSTVTYTAEPRYDMTSRTIPQSVWQALYRDVLSDLNEATRLITDDAAILPAVKANQLAEIEVISVYTWSVLINTFGNIPYSKAFDVSTTLPTYDDAATVYGQILTRLDAAIASLNANTSAAGFAAAQDVIYAGSTAKWLKFANSLKLRLAMVLADKDDAKAKTLVGQATADLTKLIASNAENPRHTFLASSPNNNLVSNNLIAPFTTRQDFVASKTIVDKMNALNDPRRPFYFTQVPAGGYVGGINGYPNTYASTSHISDKISAATFEALFMDYAEVQFLLAEAVARGYMAGSAQAYYDAAVTASITYWGGTAAQATAYLAQPAVSYADPLSGANYKEKIGTQKWIALNNRGWDAWQEWRRLDYPVLLPVVVASNTLVIPKRYIYPVSEQTQNGDAYAAAAAAMGGDLTSVKLFWDVN
jgi:hypothetical protein